MTDPIITKNQLDEIDARERMYRLPGTPNYDLVGWELDRTDIPKMSATIRRMVPMATHLAQQECHAFVEGGGPDQWICGSCPSCQARAFLAEFEKEE